MTLGATALITLNQAKAHLQLDAAEDLTVFAESVGEGDGSDTTFSLDNTPVSGSLRLFVNNVLQVEGSSSDYTITGADITFVSAPGSALQITANYEKTAASDTFEEHDDDGLEEMIDSATKIAEDYAEKAFIQRIITEYHEGDGEKTLYLNKRPIDSITSIVRDVSEGKSDGDGSTTVYTLGEVPTSGSVKVYVDAVLQTLTTDYTVSGSTVTFVSAPASGEKIAMTYTHTIIKISEYIEQLKLGKVIGLIAWGRGTIFEVIYVAGEAATRAATQVLVPDAVSAVLLILTDLYEHRGDKVDNENISGVGTTSFKMPSQAERLLFSMKPLGGFV